MTANGPFSLPPTTRARGPSIASSAFLRPLIKRAAAVRYGARWDPFLDAGQTRDRGAVAGGIGRQDEDILSWLTTGGDGFRLIALVGLEAGGAASRVT